MPDENVSSSDFLGAVIRKGDGSKQVTLGLADAVDAMLSCGEDIDIDEIKRYVDELREQRKVLLKERGILQNAIKVGEKAIINHKKIIAEREQTIEQQKKRIKQL